MPLTPPVLLISKDLSLAIARQVDGLCSFDQTEIDQTVRSSNEFQSICQTATSILDQYEFVVVKNIGFNHNARVFESFIKLFGRFYGSVEFGEIKLDCSHTACELLNIQLHNDDAIGLNSQPTKGFIQVITEDPSLNTVNGVVRISDLVTYLECANLELLEALYQQPIPMLSYGVNYDQLVQNNEIFVSHPILYKDQNQTKVRFDLERIQHYYYKKDLQQPLEEKRLIYKFLEVAKGFKYQMHLQAGDILIHNNQTTLHDRGACSLELGLKGHLNSRQIYVSFAGKADG